MFVPAIATPCVRICVVNPISTLRVGCGRSDAEIAAWAEMSDEKRSGIIGGLGERLRPARSRPARGGRRRIRAQARGGNR